MNIKIYQIEMEADKDRVKFCGLSETCEYSNKIDPSIYKKVFDNNVKCKSLDDVYQKFNTEIPDNYTGHSLSVSDVIEADGEFFFCDSIGFKKIDFDASRIIQEKTLRILVVEPQKEPYVSSVPDDYRAFQKIVGGNFECIYPDEDTVIFCNEEAKLIGLEGNRGLENDDIIAGTFFLAGDDHEGETISLTDEQIEKYTVRFKELEQFTPEEVQNTVRMEFYSY